MTPQERQLIDDLFDRLAKVEGAPRDADAAGAIAQGQRRAPNALYALVQTVLVQDEALKRADARIQELEGHAEPEPAQSGSFLDSMRGALFGQSPNQGRGSVPPSGQTGRAQWNTGQVQGNSYGQPQGGQYGQPQMGQGQYGQPQAPMGGGGGSFLGTAAAAAAGAVGGGLLMNSIRGMMGGGEGHRSAFGDTANAGETKSPWSSDSSSGNNDLARDAGVNDIGSSGQASRAGSFDQAQADADQDQDQDQDDMDSGDFDDSGDGGNDYA